MIYNRTVILANFLKEKTSKFRFFSFEKLEVIYFPAKINFFSGIAVCNTPGDCVEEVADTTLSLILNLYRRTHWLAKAVSDGRKVK